MFGPYWGELIALIYVSVIITTIVQIPFVLLGVFIGWLMWGA